MAIVQYTNKQGYKTLRLVPDGTDESKYHRGILLGPPELDDIPGLSHAQKKKLNNALVDADLVIYSQLSGRRSELLHLIRDTLGISVDRARGIRSWLVHLYQKESYPDSF